MKKLISSRLFSLTFLLFIPLVCVKKHTSPSENTQQETTVTTSSSNSSESASGSVNTATGSNTTSSAATSEKQLPKNWPWRGICFQSENSDVEDVAYLASIGVNFIRIQIKPSIRAKREKGDPKKSFYDELAWADRILDECKKQGITSLIAFNHLVLDPQSHVDDKSANFWSEKSYRDSAFKMVEIIANRYKDRQDELSAYEVVGEPAIQQKGGAKIPPGLESFFQNVLNSIRKYDKERWFLLTPGPWGKPSNYAGFEPYNIKDSKIIYGAHMYLPDPYTHQGIKERPRGFTYPGTIKGEYWDKKMLEKKLGLVKSFGDKYGFLIYIGEFQATRWSPGAETWVKDVVSINDKYNFSWSMFAFEAGTEAWDPYFDVADRRQPELKWTIKQVGPTTPLWKYMITEYEKNKKR